MSAGLGGLVFVFGDEAAAEAGAPEIESVQDLAVGRTVERLGSTVIAADEGSREDVVGFIAG